MPNSRKRVSENKHVEHIIPIRMEEDDSIIINDQNLVEEKANEKTLNLSKDCLVSSMNNQYTPSDDSVEVNKENSLKTKCLPNYNAPEKIIIVFDRAKDEDQSSFEIKSDKYTPTDMLKRGLKFFLYNKKIINHKHEYALIVLNENKASWQLDFTNDVQDILLEIEQCTECVPEDMFDMNSVFDLISKHTCYPVSKENIIPPFSIVRTLFLYNRSYTIPALQFTETVEELLLSPFYFFDVLMTHEEPSASNYCERIFNILQTYDKKGTGYFFPVSRNAMELHVAMGKLLSHPLQRPAQSSAKYN